jgi:Ca2+/Na+ antiporter
MNSYKYHFRDRKNKGTISRPTGVTVLGIIAILTTVINLSGGIFLILYQNESALQDRYVPPGPLVGVISTIGMIMITLGLVLPLVAFGLLRGRNWAWNGSVGLLVACGIVFVLMSFSTNQINNNNDNDRWILPAILTGIAIYYLYRPHVRAYFRGKSDASGVASPSSSSPPALSSY